MTDNNERKHEIHDVALQAILQTTRQIQHMKSQYPEDTAEYDAAMIWLIANLQTFLDAVGESLTELAVEEHGDEAVESFISEMEKAISGTLGMN